MIKKFVFFIIAIIFFTFLSAHAQTIIWVSEWNEDTNGNPFDQGWIDLLEAQGYNVLADTSDTYESLDTDKITALDAADLVIFSRNTNSGGYIDGGEITQWNLINSPLILLNSYLARSSRWQWIDNGTATEFTNEAIMDIVESGHEIFNGISSVSSQVDMIDETINSGQVTFITSNTVGNGTVLAQRTNNGYVWIAEWAAGVEFYSGTSQKPADKRMLFTAGGSAGQESGTLNLTEEGKQIFLNAVLYMLGAAADQKIALKPQPDNLQTDVPYNTDLSWKAGIYADTHNVFLGTDLNDVNNATIDSHDNVALAQGLDVNNFDPGSLEFGVTYYWRVDEVNAPSSPGSYKGQVWQFTVEPYALKLLAENITATAISSIKNNDPNDTINEKGLDPNHPDEHVNSVGMWLSDKTTADNPVWITYEFDKLYKLHEMMVWNYNQKIKLNSGFKEVRIEYSEDGQTWTELTATQFTKAAGSGTYIYDTVVPFNDIVAKYVRLTALSNWSGNLNGSGLSEVRFTYIPTRARIPSPETGSTDVSVDTELSWRAGREAVTHKVYFSKDENAVINGTVSPQTVSINSFSPSLDLGQTYYWSVTEVNNAESYPEWESDIWNFSMVEYVSIDDFEDYNDDPGYEIWSTWSDGYGIDENGSQMGHNPPPYSESDIVQNGKQSAPLYYDNAPAAAKSSEVTRTLDSAENWKANGADTLRLFYRGKSVTFAEPSPGVIAMSAEGADITGTADQFRFAYKTLTGNGSIVARVDGIENTNEWAKAGVMIRNTLDPNAMHAAVILASNGTSQFQRRTTKGGTTANSDAAGLGNPCWVKITRSGNTFTAEHSKDGVTWVSFETDPNTASTVTMTMSNTVYIGLAVTSHTADVVAAATFSDVATTGNVSTGAWTVAAIGDTEQAEGENTFDKLYVAIEDSTGKQAKVFAHGAAVGAGIWTEWLIPFDDFTGVNMTKVKKIAIGVGDTAAPLKGKGLIYIDNIGRGHSLE